MKNAVFVALAALCFASQGTAQNRVEGVNPADLLTQWQITGEYNRLGSGADQWLLVGKYDYKFTGSPIALNFELPVAISLDTPGFNASGNGDFFARARYIKPLGRWSVGGGLELVAPIGSDAFTGGRWQTNVSGLAVYPWNQQDITAFVHKRVFGYIEGDEAKPDINQYQSRILQIHIWPTGWFGQVDVSYWNDTLNSANWFDQRVSLGKQLSATTRMQAEIKKLSGDVRNDWAFSVSYAKKL